MAHLVAGEIVVGEGLEAVYDAFISYSRTDKAFASALERALERYTLPRELGRPRLRIFRDEEDFTGTEYYGAIERHLTSANCLIVVCSPAARASRFVNEEIASFARARGPDRIIPVLVAGIPDNEATAADERERSFPVALLECMQMPLAISYREFNPTRHRIQKGAYQAAWFSLLANIVGLSREEIEQRERKRQTRVRNYWIAGLLGMTTALSGLSIWALAERNTAAVQRDEAGKQRDVAAKERDEASKQRDEAARQRDEASRQRDTATQQTALAEYQAGVARNQTERARRALSANYMREAVLRLDRGTFHEGLGFLGAAVRLDPADLAAREATVDALLRFSLVQSSVKHEDLISDASFSADGTRIVTASHDRTARVWDARTGLPVGVPMRHDDAVAKAQFSRDGRFVVTASVDKTARIWDALTGRPIGMPLRHEHAVDGARFSDDGLRVVTASRDQTARVWNAQTGDPLGPPLRHDSQVNTAEFSPDGTRIVTAFVNGARVWNASTGDPVSPPLRHAENVFSAAFSPDGSMVVTASRDGTAQVWDARSGERIGEPLRHPTDWVTQAVFSPDGRMVLTGSPDFTARVWDARTGRPLTRSLPHGDAVRSAVFSPDSTRVMTSSIDGMVRLWDVRTQQLVAAPLRHENSNTVAARGFSADGTRVLTSADRTVQVWSTPTRQPVSTALQLGAPVINAAFTPDGRRIVTYGGVVNEWDSVTGQHLRSAAALSYAPFVRMRLNADMTLGVTTTSRESAQLWNVRTGQPVGLPMRHADIILRAELSRDGRWVVTGSADKSAQVWDSRTGRPAGPRLAHPDRVLSVGFSPDGTRVVTASERTVRVWNRTTGKLELVLQHTMLVTFASFSPDGQRIATVAGVARLWDAATGRPIGVPMKHDGGAEDAVFSNDGRRLATRSGFRNVQLWDGVTAQPLGPPLQHANVVNTVAFSADGMRVATGSFDSTARVWDVRTGQPISAPLRHFGSVYDVNFSPDGTRLITASVDGTARLWHLPVTTTKDAALIADIAEAVSGYQVSETGGLIPVEDAAVRLQALRGGVTVLAQSRTADLLRWLFEDPWQRRISPISPLTVNDYVSGRLGACTPVATREVVWYFPGHPRLRSVPRNCVQGTASDLAQSR